MNYYALALYSHFLGLVALFVGYGLEWTASSKLRRADTGEQARTWLGLYRASLPLSGPGLLLLILSGGYLASLTGSMRQGWMSASLLAIVLALIIGFALLLPRMKKVRAALPEGSATLQNDALTRVKDPMIVTLIRVRFLLALGIVYLMTLKPDTLTTSLIVLLVAIVLGTLCAASSWSSKRSS
jgi:flagellar biogenesis protein FliO